MTRREDLATAAVRCAFQARRTASCAQESAVCAMDIAAVCGLDVWFQALPSLEGMYATVGAGTIVLSSLRPPGRQAFTCAHELGHHFLLHGESWDELLEGDQGPRSEKEWAADRFASYLLMPKRAVSRAFSVRSWATGSPTALQAYTVACELGVGYTALLNQMRYSLKMLGQEAFSRLSKATPREIRRSLLGSV